jgi:hypothetical protein
VNTYGGQPGDDPVARIGEDFPGWRAWVSATGRWWAMYDAVLAPGQVSAGCLPLLHAEDMDKLAARIREQDILRAQHPAQRLLSWPGDNSLPDHRPGRSAGA